MKGYYTLENSSLYWFIKPRGGDEYSVQEFYKVGKLKHQPITPYPIRRTIKTETISRWKRYKR